MQTGLSYSQSISTQNGTPGVGEIGLSLASTMRMPASGFWMPVSNLPNWMQNLTPALPTYHLAQLALSIFGFAQPGSMTGHWGALAAFTLLMLGAAWIIFTRSEAKA